MCVFVPRQLTPLLVWSCLCATWVCNWPRRRAIIQMLAYLATVGLLKIFLSPSEYSWGSGGVGVLEGEQTVLMFMVWVPQILYQTVTLTSSQWNKSLKGSLKGHINRVWINVGILLSWNRKASKSWCNTFTFIYIRWHVIHSRDHLVKCTSQRITQIVFLYLCSLYW